MPFSKGGLTRRLVKPNITNNGERRNGQSRGNSESWAVETECDAPFMTDEATVRFSQECESPMPGRKPIPLHLGRGFEEQSSTNNETNHDETLNGQRRLNVGDMRWLALLLDTEGSICVHTRDRSNEPRYKWGHKTVTCRIQVQVGSRELVEEAQRLLFILTHKKFHITESIRGLKDNARCAMYVITASSHRDCRKICEAVIPHLFAKRRQAELMKQFCESRMKAKHTGNKPGAPSYTAEELAMVEAMKDLRGEPYTTPIRRRERETERLAPRNGGGATVQVLQECSETEPNAVCVNSLRPGVGNTPEKISSDNGETLYGQSRGKSSDARRD